MRIAISIGMARGPTSDNTKRSQKVHHCRLWWTVYMQERLVLTLRDLVSSQSVKVDFEIDGLLQRPGTPSASTTM